MNILYPRTCGSCGNVLRQSEEHICISCLIHLPRTNSHLEKTPLIEHKFAGKLLVKNTYSFLKFSKKGKVQELLHNLKYRNRPELARYIGELYGRELVEANREKGFDLIVGVPLHENRLKERGYNQADEFGMGLSAAMGVPCVTDILYRVNSTSTQTNKSRFKRFLNMEEVFEVKNADKLKAKHVLLVDDVITTGSTLASCGEALLAAGCKELSISAIASAY